MFDASNIGRHDSRSFLNDMECFAVPLRYLNFYNKHFTMMSLYSKKYYKCTYSQFSHFAQQNKVLSREFDMIWTNDDS